MAAQSATHSIAGSVAASSVMRATSASPGVMQGPALHTDHVHVDW